MTYIVNDACIKCKLQDCVEVCPVDCFYEGENMLVIHPDECIDCGVCELPQHLEERVKIIEMLWEVAYADGVVHHYEANLIRRINGLLYVSDRDSGAARKRVAARLGISP